MTDKQGQGSPKNRFKKKPSLIAARDVRRDVGRNQRIATAQALIMQPFSAMKRGRAAGHKVTQ